MMRSIKKTLLLIISGLFLFSLPVAYADDEVTVTYSITGVEGNTGGTLTFKKGETSQEIKIPIKEDSKENISVKLGTPSPSVTLKGDNNTAAIKLLGDDQKEKTVLSCTVNADCAGDNICDDGFCKGDDAVPISLKADGESCVANSECQSSNCDSGICAAKRTTSATSTSSKKTTEANVVEKTLAFLETKGETITEGTEKKIRFTVTLSCPTGGYKECPESNQCAKSLKDCPGGPSGGTVEVKPDQVDSGSEVIVSADGWVSATTDTLSYSWSASCMGGLGDHTIKQKNKSSNVEWEVPINGTGKEQNCTLSVEVEDDIGRTTTATTVLKVKPATYVSGSMTMNGIEVDKCTSNAPIRCDDLSCAKTKADCTNDYEAAIKEAIKETLSR